MFLSFQTLLIAHKDPSYKEVQVGVILDMETRVGKVVYSSITMAISDFYTANPHYKTRIVVNTRDTKGEPLRALSSVLDLLENTEVQAIIGPESTTEARFLEVLEDKTNKPILSFSTSPFLTQNPYLLQITQDETTQFKGIASMVESFKAKNVIVIAEDTENGREVATYMVSSFQEKNIHVTYTSLISTSASKEQVREELHKLQTMQVIVFVIFYTSKQLDMMGEGYMWIVTSKTTNFLDSMDVESIESMQGVVGFRSYFPASRELHNLVLKLRKEHYALNPFVEFKDLDCNGIWAYDAVYALAMALEKVQTTESASKDLGTMGTSLLNNMLRTNFNGLGGEFKLNNGRIVSKSMEVVNVVGKGGRKVGFWMMASGEFVKEIGTSNSSSNRGLETLIWPGGTATFSNRRMLQTNGKKLRILAPDFQSIFSNLIQITIDPKTNLSSASGFCWDVFNVAFNALDYGVGLEIIPFSYKDGMTYNDLIDKIALKEYDVAVGDITITSNRSRYVDFTLPFSDLGIGTIARKNKKNMWIFLDPLSRDLWITSQQIGTSLWFAFSTLVYAHREKLQSNLSRFVVTVWVFVVLVLTSSYTATLSSLLTVQQIGMKETSVGFVGLQSVGGVVYNNLNFKGAQVENLYTPEAYAKALTSGNVDAIIDEILYIKIVLAMYPGSDFSLISTSPTTNGFGFAFQKGSPLAGEMSTQIAKMRQDGTLKSLEDEWLKRQSTLMSKDFSSPSPKILNLYGFRGLFLISGVTMAFALLVSMPKRRRLALPVTVHADLGCTVAVDWSRPSGLGSHEDPSQKEVQVGVILDMESGVGKFIYPLDLLKNTEVQAIIGPESTAKARFLEVLGDKANVPIISISTSHGSNLNPYFLKIAKDETAQFKGIAAMVESFKAKNVIVICEDTLDEREMAAYMFSAFQKRGVHVTHTSLISTSSNKEQFREELLKLQTMQDTVFIMHTPPSLTSNIFSSAKELGMMGERYKWIVTSKTTNFMASMDAEAIEDMQGVVVYAVAMAVERVHTTDLASRDLATIGKPLLNQMLRFNFHGLGGEFKFINGRTITKSMEVANVIGEGGRRVGFWMMATGEFVKEYGKPNSSSNHGLKRMTWPSEAATISKRRILQTNGKKLKILVPDFDTFPNLVELSVDPRTNVWGVSGFCWDVFNASLNALNYGAGVEITPYPYKDGCTYNDLIYKVYLKEYDVAIGDITITENRSLYVDFTIPFTNLGIGTLARNTKKSIWIFLDLFSTNLWITSACFFLFLGFVIWFIEHRTNKKFQGSAGQQIGTTLWFAFSTLVYAHREKLQSNLSRFVVIVWVFVVLVLTSSYTATLSSVLTIEQIGMKEIKVGLQSASPLRGAIFKNLNFKIEKLYTHEAYSEALRNGNVDAIMDEVLYVKTILAMYLGSHFSLIATSSTTNGFGFVFRKGWPMPGEMSTQIAKMREDGTLKALEDKWLNGLTTRTDMDADTSDQNNKVLFTRLHFRSSFVKVYLCINLDHPPAGNLKFLVPMEKYCRLFPFLILMLISFQTLLTAHEDTSYNKVQVGVILDMESLVSKVIYNSITMAISDFYTTNPHYKTRIMFNTRDTKGEPLHALSAAVDFLENTEVQAIIGPESTDKARFLDILGDKANVLILSFATSPFSNPNPYFLRIIDDETNQFKGIASMVESFKAKNAVVICEDNANGREMATYMVSEFQRKHIHVTYTSLISTYASKEQVREELHKLQTMQTMVFVMHTPPSLSSNLFSMAKELGMMGEGYIWITTSKTTNFLDSIDAEAIESMQGAVGFRSYFPASRKLHNFVSKLRKEHYALNRHMEFKDLDSYGIWAYDAVYALAMAVEKVQTTELASKDLGTIGTSLLNQILRVNFRGLGGEFKFINGTTISKSMEVVNVIGKGGRRFGFWTATDEFVKEIGKLNSSFNPGLEIATISKRRMLQTNGKKLRILAPEFGTFPNLFQLTVDPITNLSGVSGFCGDVFNSAFDAINYGVGIEIITLTYNDGMSYDTIIEKVYLKEYDGAVGDITITSNRSLYVDFTLPFTDLGIGTIARNSKKSMWIFLYPLSADLWITSSCFFLFLGFVIWFIEHRSNEEFQGSTSQQIGTILWFAFSTLVYAHREKLQSNISRFVVTVWVFIVLVLTSSYTATLSSLLTVQQIGRNQISAGFLGIFEGGVFNNSNFGVPKTEKLYTPEAYVKALKSGSVDSIINEIPYLKTVIGMYPSSDLSLIATASTTSGFGFVFQKGSPLASEMSTQIAKMREDGTLKALEDKWLIRHSPLMSKDSSSPSPTILNRYGFRGLFIVSGGTMLFALLVSMYHEPRASGNLNFVLPMVNCGSSSFLILMLLSFQIFSKAHEDPSYKEVKVGVILDMESGVGKVICRCITMAISDFYTTNPHYKTRIVFNTRDAKGEPLRALSSALDLLDNTEVEAIIGPESTVKSSFLEVLRDKVNIPILSFSTSPFSNQNPYILRITQDETIQFKGIATMVESFIAKNVIVICEDTANGKQMATYMVSSFLEKNIHVTYTSLISTSKVDEELHKLQTMQNTVFVMHAQPSLASTIFSSAKILGMMDEGYMWIVTSKTTNFLDSMDAKAIESMQGVMGFKSYFPSSRDLNNFVSKWKKKHYALNQFMEFDPKCIWAYDAVYALAMAVEKIQTTKPASKDFDTIDTSLLYQILRVNFHGLGGEFKFMNGRIISKSMEIVNVIGKGSRRVGFWTTTNEFVKEIGKPNSSSNHILEITTISNRRILQTNGKKLRIIVPNFTTFPNLVQLTIDPITNQSGVSGFCWDVFYTAFNALGYGVGIEIIPYPYKDGRTYNDLIEKVHFKEYDVAIGDITITENRSLYVDFTLPFTDLGTGTIARNAKKSIWIFLDPLSADLWITSACFFLFLGFIIWFIEHRTNKEFQGSTSQQIGTTLWFAFSTLVYAHRENVKSNLSRFVVTVWVFVVLVLTSSYTATLSSVLTVQQIGMKDIEVRLQGASPLRGAIYNNLNFKIEKLYTHEAYTKALSNPHVDAIVDEILYVKTILEMYPGSHFSLIAKASTTNGFGFVFQKGSPMAGELSTQIKKMREDGTLKALEDKWLKSKSTVMTNDFSSPSPKILNLYGFRGLFLISGVSMAFALFVSMDLSVLPIYGCFDSIKNSYPNPEVS
ncbi:hypothetical protein LXL04_036735 [Taraxacum kok-saghyz]